MDLPPTVINRFYRRHGKRLFDLALTIPGTAAVLPVLAASALAVRLTMGSPVLFRQKRVGRDGQVMDILKFRTMRLNDVDPLALGKVTTDTDLVTPVGKVLRRLKLDELPQVFNVLFGDMSLVGPRPTLEAVVEHLMTPEHLRRHQVTPGITGLAQVLGNIELDLDERVKADLYYVDNLSLPLDMKILWMTVAVLLRGEKVKEEVLHELGIRGGGGL